MPLPLAGRRVLVTRAAHQAGKLSEGLRALGADPIEVPLLEIQPPHDYQALDAALGRIHAYDWLILTSANAVRAIEERAHSLEISLHQATAIHVAAIGQSTAAEARRIGLTVSLVPESYVAEDLLAALAGKATGKRVLLARAAVARDVIPDALRAAGATVDVVDAYRNVMPEDAPHRLRGALADGIDAATFTSSSSATRLAEAAAVVGIPFPFAGVPAISIGPITTRTLVALGWAPAVEADPSDVSGLIAAVVRALSAGPL